MWKADIAKVIIAINYFHKTCQTWQDSEDASGFEYSRVLNIPEFWMLGLHRVPNMPE